jgi:hypothetical protein
MTENFFDKYGLEMQNVKLEGITVGERYPIYGMVTNVVEHQGKTLKVEVNFNLLINMLLDSPEKAEIIKERSFEPGVFIVKVLSISDDIESKYSIEGDCQTVIFGKRQEFNG